MYKSIYEWLDLFLNYFFWDKIYLDKQVMSGLYEMRKYENIK